MKEYLEIEFESTGKGEDKSLVNQKIILWNRVGDKVEVLANDCFDDGTYFTLDKEKAKKIADFLYNQFDIDRKLK